MSTEENPDYELSEKVSDGVGPISEEKPLEDAGIDSDKLKDDDQVVNSVNLLSGNADQILPLLQNLLIQNDIQREKLMGLIQLYDPTAENRNAVVNAEGGQIATETVDLSTMVQFLEQIVQKLEEELENQKKTNAQLEDEINRLTKMQ